MVMNKTALKNFATSARRELLEKVELQARNIGITADTIQKAEVESSDSIFIGGKQLSAKDRVQRNKLISRIRYIGFDRVMEEVAYTWFNRFTALRFMEVNDYLPTKVRVLSSINKESAEPDMMKEAMSLDLSLDKEYVYELKMSNKNEELFKYLIIKHCNDLNRYMPFMFETIDDYTEILFPAGLLAADSCIRRMTNVEVIPESNWQKIEVIGWLYQYYIVEEKDRVFKAKKKYKAEEIPFATQLFTPDWIVRYMVQNSLGRYWVEASPEHRDLINNWEFYLQNTEEDFEEKIAPYINKELKVEEIKCFDPAMGSGHILVYMFDVLYEIYGKSGYQDREIPRLIIENNLFGLDIDDRAYQLASFSVVMKALEYNKRFLRSIEKEGLTLNLASVQETNNLTKDDIEFLADRSNENLEETRLFVQQFQDAKTIGSLIKLTKGNTRYLQKRLESIQTTPVTDLFEVEQREKVLFLLPNLIKQAKIMSLKFDILITNPPYMGSGNMNEQLSDYLRQNYPDSKVDLYAAFMEIDHYLKENGFYASINQHTWMSLSSLQKLRRKIIKEKFIENMLHLGPRAFEEIGGEVVQSTTFVLRNTSPIQNTNGIYLRLTEENTARGKKEQALKAIRNPLVAFRYSFNQGAFNEIPGSPIAYWIDKNILEVYTGEYIADKYSLKEGVGTRNDSEFLKLFWEVSMEKIGIDKRWVFTDKAGNFKKWYMGFSYVMDWENNGFRIKNYRNPDGSLKSRPQNLQYLFKEGVTWGKIGAGKPSFRWRPSGYAFNDAAPTIFGENSYLLLGLLNSKLYAELLKIQGETLNLATGIVGNLPILKLSDLESSNLNRLIDHAVTIATVDWNDYETSFEFERHPVLEFNGANNTLEDAYNNWINTNNRKREEIKKTEEKISELLIEKYELGEIIASKVKDEDISLHKNNIQVDIKSFISYAIGCLFGRYSLDEKNIIYAGGDFNPSLYKTYSVDKENILPILSGSYFEDDIIGKLVDFVGKTFGEKNLEKNLIFIANAIGLKKNETAKETIRRYFLNDFYKDHTRTYKKRPIYWLFTSGKEKAFNCLIYMHRYDKTTLSRIRTDYLHEVQIRLDAEKKDLLNIIEGESTTKEISNAKKTLRSIDKKIDELKAYDELLHHKADMQIEIDLDDGVIVNYEKFNGLVAII